MRAFLVVAAVAGLVGCTKPNPAVCCSSRADCESIGANSDQRLCASGFVCMDHTCTEPQCTTNDQCTTATTPVCDPGSLTCRGCAKDDECPSAVCDLGTGACIDESTVVYASTTGSTTADCTKAAPCEINRAFTVANAGRSDIKLMPGIYDASITINDRTLSIHGAGATVQDSAADGHTFTVADNGHVTFSGVTIVRMAAQAGSRVALYCSTTSPSNSPSIDLVDVVLDSSNLALFMSACTGEVRRSTLNARGVDSVVAIANAASLKIDRSLLNGSAFIASLGGPLRITNSIIRGLTDPTGGIQGAAGGAVWISFSTLYDSHVGICGTGAPSCSGASLNGVCIDNSIIVNNSSGAPGDTVGTGCRVDHTIVSPQTMTLGGTNMLNVDPKFVNAVGGDFHLLAGSPAVGAADPAAPATPDFDGTQRPQGGGADLGAFELGP